MLSGWGEVTANINERNYPRHPSGTFGLCLKGANVALPKGTQRIDLPNRKSRILMRIELGANPAEAVALQKAAPAAFFFWGSASKAQRLVQRWQRVPANTHERSATGMEQVPFPA